MQYLVCSRCGFANETIESACIKCGTALDRSRPSDSADLAHTPQAPAAPGLVATGISGTGKAAGAVFRAAMQPLDNLQGEYPWLHRFITYVRVAAKILYVLGLLQVAVLLVGGIISTIAATTQSGGVLNGTLYLAGGILLTIIAALVSYLLVWLGYMFMMALPDFLECVLRIENNTRTA